MFYDKKIKYVNVYENGERGQSAGFVRLEARENKVKMQLQVSGLKTTDTMNCLIVLEGAGKEATLGELHMDRGKGVAEFAALEATDLVGGIGYQELEEIQIRPGGARVLRCIVQERTKMKVETKEKAVTKEEIETKENIAEGEEWFVEENVVVGTEILAEKELSTEEAYERIEVKSEAELLKEAFLAEKRLREGENEQPMQQVAEVAEEEHVVEPSPVPKHVPQARQSTIVREQQPIDKWQQLLAIYPHIRPFEDRREYLLMKPQDFVVLTDKYFSLSGNSFLLHGYYNYDHLIMSKERRPEGERFYIGVPGNFYDKEKQVAIMFGFESFEGKREPARTGDFGYYLIPVEI